MNKFNNKQRMKEFFISTQPFRFIGKSIRNIFFPAISDGKPNEVHIEVSSLCNAKCIFCNYQIAYRKRALIDTDFFRKIATEAYLLGYKRLNLTSMGGELFMHPNAIDIIQFARDIGYEQIDTYTNGILLHKFDLKKLIFSGLSTLKISFPGFDRDEYKLIYGVDKYEEFIKSISALLKLHSELPGKLKIIFEPRSRYKLKDIYNSKTFKEELAPYISDYVVINKPIVRYDSWSSQIKQSDLPSGLKLEWNPVKSIYPLKKVNLCSRLVEFGVLVNGDVRMCNCRYDSTIEENDSLRIGNLKGYRDLPALLSENHEKMETIKQNFILGQLPELCLNCAFYLPVKIR